MSKRSLEITVYGADQPCPSCLHSPSSIETKEWLVAAITRKYPNQSIQIRYVDINRPETDSDLGYTEKILKDEYFYPLIVAGGQVVGEGNPRLKTIYKVLDEYGFKPA